MIFMTPVRGIAYIEKDRGNGVDQMEVTMCACVCGKEGDNEGQSKAGR